MVSEQIKNAIKLVKTGGQTISNVYVADAINKANLFVSNADAVLLVVNDHGVNRLYYYAHGLENIKELLQELPDDEYVLEYMTKDPNDYTDELNDLGFVRLARMMRMAIRDYATIPRNETISCFYDETIGVCPDVAFAGEINQVLWNVFDTRVSHLLTDEELGKAINNKEVLIHQNEFGTVNAVLQTICNPRKFYINQVYNGAAKNIIHAMLQKRLKEYVTSGGKYVYAWVEYDNIASVKFHQKYGLQHDGMWNMVYVLKKG